MRPTADCQKNTLKTKGFFHYAHCGLGFTIRPRPDDFYEPPRADPHAWWCGEGRLKAVPYPIGQSFLLLAGVTDSFLVFERYHLPSIRMFCGCMGGGGGLKRLGFSFRGCRPSSLATFASMAS